VGTVVHVYRDGLAYEVEFTTLDGKTAAVVTVEAAAVRPVGKREITHARELAEWVYALCGPLAKSEKRAGQEQQSHRQGPRSGVAMHRGIGLYFAGCANCGRVIQSVEATARRAKGPNHRM
jgi:hypothetical protein